MDGIPVLFWGEGGRPVQTKERRWRKEDQINTEADRRHQKKWREKKIFKKTLLSAFSHDWKKEGWELGGREEGRIEN